MVAERSADVADKLCELIACGISIKDACEELEFPRRSFYAWCAKDEQFCARIARARETGQDALADEMVDIADSATEEDYNAKKLQIWTRQWVAAKRAPRKFGDNSQVAITGADGGPLQIQWKGKGSQLAAIEVAVTDAGQKQIAG